MGQVIINAVTNSGSPSLTLNAAWTLEQPDTMLAARSPTLIEYHQREWSRTKQFNIPITLVSSGDADTINGWWRTAQVLDFTLNSSEASTVQVQINNTQYPIGQFDPPYFEKYQGTLILRAIDNSDFGANP